MGFPFAAFFTSMLATATPSYIVAADTAPVADTVPAAEQSVPLIEPAQLGALMKANVRVVIVDVREPDEFAQGHIDGAIPMPLGTLAARYGELPKDAQLVVYCRSGHRSAKAVAFLLAHGYSRAVSLHGGYMAWAAS
ncbi:MAG: rhodanese-like domain-containing protein [Alphaproteobacteria bacterium]|nr:rhodanese-like domain-containing protein [Alphaproteobacteria bacterium]